MLPDFGEFSFLKRKKSKYIEYIAIKIKGMIKNIKSRNVDKTSIYL